MTTTPPIPAPFCNVTDPDALRGVAAAMRDLAQAIQDRADAIEAQGRYREIAHRRGARAAARIERDATVRAAQRDSHIATLRRQGHSADAIGSLVGLSGRHVRRRLSALGLQTTPSVADRRRSLT